MIFYVLISSFLFVNCCNAMTPAELAKSERLKKMYASTYNPSLYKKNVIESLETGDIKNIDPLGPELLISQKANAKKTQTSLTKDDAAIDDGWCPIQ